MRAYQEKVENSGATADGRLSAEEDSVRFYELSQAVTTAGITPDTYGGPDTDKKQLAQAIARYAAGGGFHGTDGGSANAYVLTALGSFQPTKSYTTGLSVEFFPANTNTDASTINAFAIGLKPIYTEFGAPLSGGEIVKGVLTQLIYDGSLNGGTGAFKLKPWGARYRNLPIFPEITASNNVFTFATSTGQIIIDTGLSFIHRGWTLIKTSSFSSGDRTFATAINKTYHLRWHAPGTGDATDIATYPNGRFRLNDLADSGYNPGAAAETSSTFDSTYDDMLIARVVTDGSNVLTVTALANKATLTAQASLASQTPTTGPSAAQAYDYSPSVTLNWSRAPKIMSVEGMITGNAISVEGYSGWVSSRSATRYAMTASIGTDWRESEGAATSVLAHAIFDALA